jgi:hypothetical protein
MKRFTGVHALVVVGTWALVGCAGAGAVEPGLANAPAIPGSETIDVHDAIANAHDSCPRARVAALDPLRYRYPPCSGGELQLAPSDPLDPPAPTNPKEDFSD